MLSFENDYSCTATPEIIEHIEQIAQNQYPGYGNTASAKARKPRFVRHVPAPTLRSSSW